MTKNPTALRRCTVMLYQISQLTDPEIGAVLRSIAAAVSAVDARIRLLNEFGAQGDLLGKLAGRVNELVTEYPDYNGLFKPDDGRQFSAADLEDPDSPVHEAVRKTYRRIG